MTNGATVTGLVIPASPTPHELLYQVIDCGEPPPPPIAVSVTELPLQIVVEDAVIDVGAVDFWLTVTVTCAHVVFELHGAGSS